MAEPVSKRRRGTRFLTWGGLLLVVNSIYLSLDANPHFFYFGNLLLHLGLGLVLLVPALFWLLRNRSRFTVLSGLCFILSTGFGLAMAKFGNMQTNRHLLIAHIALAVLGLALLVPGLRRMNRPRSRTLALWSTVGVAVAALLAPWAKSAFPGGASEITNPPAPLSMAEEAMGGADGPFFPSSVRTSNGGPVPDNVYLGSESCARAGCHPDVYDQWQESAHRFSSFNNQWYRKSVEYLQEFAGVTSSKWCGGCHDPAILQTGMMDTPIEEIVHTPQAQAGLGCTACHMISDVHSTMGQGDYEITVPPLHDLATSENRILQELHDLVVRMDPEPHRRTFFKPIFFNEHAAEFCSTCHKVHLDVPVNSYRWFRGFNEYDNWQASGVSGQGARSFYYPPEPRLCRDCHMPLVPSDDAGHDDGFVRSHRFPGANTALPVANRHHEQLEVVTEFLQSRQVTVDIFAMTEGSTEIEEDQDARAGAEGGELHTTFAVGEEAAFSVTPATSTEAKPVIAPLDRVRPTLVRGENVRVDVVVRTRGVGHFFPGGTVDAYDTWLELQATDSKGRIVYWSGMADEDSPVDDGAHFYRSLMIDAHGNPIDKRNAPAARAVVYVRLIPPGAADTVRFRLQVPPDTADELTLTAKLNYRKFSWFNTHWAYAGEPDPEAGGEFSPHFDDRTFVFTKDTSDVSGELKEIPKLPIVVMAEDTVTLPVANSAPEQAPVAEPVELDRERWNDYGIGLLRQGDLRAAEAAFTKVTEIEPEYVDGWVNLGRVAAAEGDLERAEEVLGRALAMEPELPRAHFFAALADKERGDYPAALEHLRTAASQYPKDRVVRNQMARVHFLSRDYAAAVAELERVLAIDPEDLMAHYTAMLAYRGLGDLERSAYHQTRYERFKADESAQSITGDYRERHPEDNNERLAIHEHVGVTRQEIQAFLDRQAGQLADAGGAADGGGRVRSH